MGSSFSCCWKPVKKADIAAQIEPKQSHLLVSNTSAAPIATTEEYSVCSETGSMTGNGDDFPLTPSSNNLSDFLNNGIYEDEHMESPPASSSSQITVVNVETAYTSSPRKYVTVPVNTVQFRIPEAYQALNFEYLGSGAYGSVVKADVDCRDGQRRSVAIKKLKDAFNDPVQARRTFREIRLLQLMKHDNIISAIDLYTPDTVEHNFSEVYLVTEYAGNSLFKILKTQQDSGQTLLSAEHIKFILYQLLRALKYIHSANIMHRDLKPGNLALTNDCDLTVLDFGLARSLEKSDPNYTQYVMTRWYRSPEVIYWKIDSYNTQADVWSVGCIAAELISGHPLFKGEDAIQQYNQITRLVGSPDEELLAKIEGNEENGKHMRRVIETYDHHDRVDFNQYFGRFTTDSELLDFLDKMLVLDPEKRMTVDQALSHSYMEQYHDPKDEPIANWQLDDTSERSVQGWKGVIWQEILQFVGTSQSPRTSLDASNS